MVVNIGKIKRQTAHRTLDCCMALILICWSASLQCRVIRALKHIWLLMLIVISGNGDHSILFVNS